jgi:signal transduction histidine kinase
MHHERPLSLAEEIANGLTDGAGFVASSSTSDMERSIARCRVFLSLAAILAIYIDPAAPALLRSLSLAGGIFVLDRYWVPVLLAHLTYSLTLAWAQERSITSPARLAKIATWGDVFFGAAIALVTEGETSIYYVFFAFAVLTVGLRWGLRSALTVTAASIGFYLLLTVASAPEHEHFVEYVMRAGYLAMTGYLVGYLGQERLNQEASLRALESDAQRERIARSLHDGYAQALAGVNLRLENCQELFRRGQQTDAMAELGELQSGVKREYDQLRTYIRSLVEREPTTASVDRHDETRFSVHAEFGGSPRFVEHILHIMLEGTRNVRRHARARSAAISARTLAGHVVLSIDDDGVGFPDGSEPPWSIASRVSEFRGELVLRKVGQPGGHLLIQLPAA